MAGGAAVPPDPSADRRPSFGLGTPASASRSVPLDQFEHEGQLLEVRVPWHNETLWLVPEGRDTEALDQEGGVERGRVWTARELAAGPRVGHRAEYRDHEDDFWGRHRQGQAAVMWRRRPAVPRAAVPRILAHYGSGSYVARAMLARHSAPSCRELLPPQGPDCRTSQETRPVVSRAISTEPSEPWRPSAPAPSVFLVTGS